MKNKTLSVIVSAVLIAVIALGVFAQAPVAAASLAGRGGPNGSGTTGRGGQGTTNGQGTGQGLFTGVDLIPLSDAEAAALQEAILEEYGAYNLYQAVIEQLGSQLPFSRILRSEQQHIRALVRQAEKYGVTVPENVPAVAPVFATLAEACQAGVNAEIADAALYDELKLVTTHADLLRVYTQLQNASLNSHLPAFEACN